jgi:SAM-dependent methyltransferase
VLARAKKAIREPHKILPYLRYKLASLRVRKVRRDGILYHRYKGELYPDYLNHGNAASFILETAQRYCRGRGIDVGANAWPFPGAVPIENEPHQNAHRLDAFADGSLDYVFSSHCLEHLDRWEEALDLWIRKLRPGGVLFLYLPHESMKLWNPGAPWVMNGHRWQPTLEILLPFLEGRGLEILDYEPYRDTYWSFHIAARKPGGEASSAEDGSVGRSETGEEQPSALGG